MDMCVFPCIGERLYDYIVGLVADTTAEEFEEHLLGCGYCRELYLNLLCLSGAMSTAKTNCADEGTRKISERDVLNFAAFRSRLP